MSKIVFNGKSYSSVDEMPPEIRKAYEQVIGIFADQNRDGIPDLFEGSMGASDVTVQSISIQSDHGQIFVDGKAYSSIEEMPAEARQKFEQAMASLGQMLKDANRNNMPDILEGVLASPSVPSTSQESPQPAPEVRRPWQESTSTVVSDVSPNIGRVLLLLGIAIVVLLVLVGAYAAWIVFR